jgi:hypothetical protein
MNKGYALIDRESFQPFFSLLLFCGAALLLSVPFADRVKDFHAGGIFSGIPIYYPLVAAMNAIEPVEAQVKHLLLFSDGKTADEYRATGIDEDALRQIARATGGRFLDDEILPNPPSGVEAITYTDVHSHFLLAALALFLVELAVRKLPRRWWRG